MSETRRFHWKAFVSFYVVLSFIALGLSGIVLYVAPPGRIANWSVWRLVALSKAQWQSIHTTVALLFIVAASFHLYFNWKVLMAYVRTRLAEGLRMKRELGSAVAAGLAILTLSVVGAPPFSSVMAFGDDVKNSWSTAATEPPVPHAELMTVEKLAETVKIPIDKVIANLQRNGITVDSPQVTVQQLADRNALTPQQVYQRIQGDDAKPSVGLLEGGGWGRMNVQQVCERAGIPVETGVARLLAAGIIATGTSALRELATAQDKSPIEIAKLIAGEAVQGPATAGRRDRPGDQ